MEGSRYTFPRLSAILFWYYSLGTAYRTLAPWLEFRRIRGGENVDETRLGSVFHYLKRSGSLDFSHLILAAAAILSAVSLSGCGDASAEQASPLPEAVDEPTPGPPTVASVGGNGLLTDGSSDAGKAKTDPPNLGIDIVEGAYAKLLSVQSARVAEERVMDRLGGGVILTSGSPAVHQDVNSGKGALTEEVDCVEAGSYRGCDLVEKDTGEKVGYQWFAGGRRLRDGVFVPPASYCRTSKEIFDIPAGAIHPPEIHPPEGWSAAGGAWSENEGGQGDTPLFLHLFDLSYFDSIELLDYTELEGTPVAHLRAGYVNPKSRTFTLRFRLAL